MCDNTKGTVRYPRLHNRGSNDLSLSVRSRDASAKSCAVSHCVNDSSTCITKPDKTIINYLICPVGRGEEATGLVDLPNCKTRDPGSFFAQQFPTAASAASSTQFYSFSSYICAPSYSSLLCFHSVVLVLMNYDVQGTESLTCLR